MSWAGQTAYHIFQAHVFWLRENDVNRLTLRFSWECKTFSPIGFL